MLRSCPAKAADVNGEIVDTIALPEVGQPCAISRSSGGTEDTFIAERARG
jgi:hypothetical protein